VMFWSAVDRSNKCCGVRKQGKARNELMRCVASPKKEVPKFVTRSIIAVSSSFQQSAKQSKHRLFVSKSSFLSLKPPTLTARAGPPPTTFQAEFSSKNESAHTARKDLSRFVRANDW